MIAAERGADRGRARWPTAVASPAALIVATEVVADAQVTWLVRSCVELSEKVPVAVNCSGQPLGDARVGRRHGDRLQHRGGDRQHRRAGDRRRAWR